MAKVSQFLLDMDCNEYEVTVQLDLVKLFWDKVEPRSHHDWPPWKDIDEY